MTTIMDACGGTDNSNPCEYLPPFTGCWSWSWGWSLSPQSKRRRTWSKEAAAAAAGKACEAGARTAQVQPSAPCSSAQSTSSCTITGWSLSAHQPPVPVFRRRRCRHRGKGTVVTVYSFATFLHCLVKWGERARQASPASFEAIEPDRKITSGACLACQGQSLLKYHSSCCPPNCPRLRVVQTGSADWQLGLLLFGVS